MNVIDFPVPPTDEQQPLLVGPFSYYKVVVEGRAIPKLTGYTQDDGRVTLIVDGRFAVDFPADIASSAAWLIANALAIGAGYSHLGATSQDHPFAPKIAQVGDAP